MQFASVGAIRGSLGWILLLLVAAAASPLGGGDGTCEGEGGEKEEEGYRGCCWNRIRHLEEGSGWVVCWCFLISVLLLSIAIVVVVVVLSVSSCITTT